MEKGNWDTKKEKEYEYMQYEKKNVDYQKQISYRIKIKS